ncbi:hypothetical protein VM95_09045 [Streptomyces rubellomurinus]|uniref:Uncharacterized protein n=1 Tax=Streptomyces rubellomurinus (strain ATCC 31215) TaxID=359131 RepID=A0A0F2TIH8_STRR3|nr:hypothetical protein VM95_09045 [Streptomyces rubellomurinus]
MVQASETRRPQRIRMRVISRADGSDHRSRFAGCSTWVMMCSARWRASRVRRRGPSPVKNAALVGSEVSQPCWRMAWKNKCRPLTRPSFALSPPWRSVSQAR